MTNADQWQNEKALLHTLILGSVLCLSLILCVEGQGAGCEEHEQYLFSCPLISGSHAISKRGAGGGQWLGNICGRYFPNDTALRVGQEQHSQSPPYNFSREGTISARRASDSQCQRWLKRRVQLGKARTENGRCLRNSNTRTFVNSVKRQLETGI